MSALVGGALLLALFTSLWAARRSAARSKIAARALLAAVLVFLAARVALWSSTRPAEPVPELPQQVRDQGFASARACESCHPEQYQSWFRSYHRSMTQVVTRDSVLARFDGVHLENRGRELFLERRGDQYWVNLVDPDHEFARMSRRGEAEPEGEPPRVWKQAVMSTGSHYQQTYWVTAPEAGGLVQIGWSWLVDEQRWIPREDLFLTPDRPERMRAVWNMLCVRCHASNGRPATPEEPMQIGSKVADLGIACESCHGPAEAHVRLNQSPLRRYELHLEKGSDESVVNPAKLPHDRSSMVCGRCHSVSELKDQRDWWLHGDRYQPGADLRETRELYRHEPGSLDYVGAFWGDGTYKAAGREFSGLEMSKCYTEGTISCVSCHSMHESDPNKQLARGLEGDEGCLQCHEGFRDRIAEHSHHPADSSGARCLNCHMPYSNYALFSAGRTHRIDSPSVEKTTLFGRPNACNLCHLDQTLDWTGKQLERWYQIAETPLSEDQSNIAAGVLWALNGDASERALAAWHMGWAPARQAAGEDWTGAYLAQLLEDPYAAVRRVTARSLRKIPAYASFAYDPLEQAESRHRANRRLRSLWQERNELRDRAELLISEDGRIDEATFQRLLGARNDRPVTINE